MISLDENFKTNETNTFNGTTTTTVTDTLFVSEVRIDLSANTLVATIRKGYIIPEYPGVLRQTLEPVTVTVNLDGSFTSTDGLWVGSLGPAASNLINQLKATFDAFVLASGTITGNVIS